MVACRLHPPALYAPPEERLVQTGHADQSVDHGGQSGDLAEGQAEQRGDQVETGDATSPQFSAPTTTSTAATTSMSFIAYLQDLNIMQSIFLKS
jgi:hypothetical protein